MMKNDSIYNSKGIENIKTMEDLMVFLRRYRMGLIQTPQQLRYSWQAIIDGLQRNQKDETKESSKTCDGSKLFIDLN
jgi:GTP cyclohydrolase I